MKKIIVFFIIIFILIASPVNASREEDNYNNHYIQYKLEKENKEDSNGGSLVFWGMIAVAFLAISVFLIAYKSDDDL